MLRYIVSMLLVLWLVATIAFVCLRLLPGDAIDAQLAQGGASQDRIDQIRRQMGLDDSLLTQYRRYLSDLLHGDLGYSLLSGQPVLGILQTRVWSTVTLAGLALVLAVFLGLAIGIIAAFDSVLSQLAQFAIVSAISTPIYVSGTLAVYVFALWLDLLPATGSSSWRHLVLPVVVLGFHTMGEIARVVQVNVAEMRSALHVRTAHSKGLHSRTVLSKHILRVGLLPAVTVIALQAGFLLSGTIITEILFVRPGLGTLLLDSSLNQDYPVVQGVAILSAMIYVLLSGLAELLHRLLDPRISL